MIEINRKNINIPKNGLNLMISWFFSSNLNGEFMIRENSFKSNVELYYILVWRDVKNEDVIVP